VGLQEGLWRGVGPGTQGGSLTLCLCHQAVRHLCILSMVAWLSDSQCQEKTKQNPKIGLLRDKRGSAHPPTHPMEALICLPPLELVVQSEARMAAHHLWSLGRWSYLHHNRGHSSILKRLQQSDPIFNMGVDVMRSTFNLEPKYRVTMLTREDWTRGSGSPPEVKGLIWYTDGSKMKEGTGAEVFGQSVKRRLSFPLGRYTTVFQAEIYAILACVYEIQFQNRLEKYVSICSDSQAALKALQAVITMSPLVHQCQKELNDISALHVVGLYWVPGHAGVRGNETADGLTRGGPTLGFPGPEPALGVSRRDIRKRLSHWLINQQWASWCNLGNTLRQAQELISGTLSRYQEKIFVLQ